MAIDIVSRAIEDMIKIKELIDKSNSILMQCNLKPDADGAGIARRSKDLPQLVYTIGLVPSLIFYMSKSEEKTYKTILEYLNQSKINESSICECRNNRCSKKDLANELGKGEGAGYTTLLALSTRYLLDEKYLNNIDDFKKLAENLNNLRKNNEAIASDKLVEYLVQIKRLSEAFFGE
ncbi:MAG: type III-B CRISPR module-associated protein Cmr5 [Desulfurococcales archaeon]|nr:type III-B CRISPR module-associated protein Cmr5 [Desulfurococcales archaeon]